MLSVGDPAPDFSLPDASGRMISLGGLLAAGPLILYFYPSDFTPVCTRQACMVRDASAELAAAGLQAAGISPNPAETHRYFAERFGLGQVLLSDPQKTVIGAYGARGPLGFGVRRATFLIDTSGRIEDVVSAAFNVGRHETMLRRAIEISPARKR